jgi:hypothetical protein
VNLKRNAERKPVSSGSLKIAPKLITVLTMERACCHRMLVVYVRVANRQTGSTWSDGDRVRSTRYSRPEMSHDRPLSGRYLPRQFCNGWGFDVMRGEY